MATRAVAQHGTWRNMGCWATTLYGLRHCMSDKVVQVTKLYRLRSCTGYEVVQVTRACATKCYETERVSAFNNSSC